MAGLCQNLLPGLLVPYSGTARPYITERMIPSRLMAWLTALGADAIRWQPMRFELSGSLWIGIAVCAVFATAAAFSLQLWAQQYTTPSHAAILFTLEPVFAVATSYVMLGERLGLRSLLGAALVLAGILAAELLGPPAAPESPEPTQEFLQGVDATPSKE